MELVDRYRGCLLGLACGDAVGTTDDACRYMAGIIVGALKGEIKEALLVSQYCPILGYWNDHPLCPEITEIAAGFFDQRNPPEIKGTGYVVQSLEDSPWVFRHSTTFKDGCLLAVNLREDADATVEVYGQIAGACYGEDTIPPSCRIKLSLFKKICSLADKVYLNLR